jgi:hypothetical protein
VSGEVEHEVVELAAVRAAEIHVSRSGSPLLSEEGVRFAERHLSDAWDCFSAGPRDG